MKSFYIVMISLIMIANINQLFAIENIIISRIPADSLDISEVHYIGGAGGMKSIVVFDENGEYAIAGNMENTVDSLIINTGNKYLNEVDYSKKFIDLNIGGVQHNSSIVIEIQNDNNTIAHGYIYITGNQIYSNVSQELQDSIESQIFPVMDSTYLSNGWNTSTPPVNFTSGSRTAGDAYIISFDQPDPYESGYTLAELDYEYIYQNSATDYLEKILDTDRNNELVGFRYYSDLNGQEYIIFIKANN